MNPYSINKEVLNTKKFKQFDKYVLRGMKLSDREKMRLYHSRAEDTIVSYTKVVKQYVLESRDPVYPVTEKSVRKFIDTLDVEEDRTTLKLLKPSLIFTQKCRSDPNISFNTADLVLEGILRELGNNFPNQVKHEEIKEVHVRKFLLEHYMDQH